MKKLQGVIISHRMQKTVVVRVDRLVKHPIYLKYYRVSKKFKAHDEHNEFQTGDTVIIQETRPLSKEKRWKVIELVKRLPVVVEEDETANVIPAKAGIQSGEPLDSRSSMPST